MSILTKISVIVMVVASLVASVVFFNIATTTPNWHAFYNQVKVKYDNSIKENSEKDGIIARQASELTDLRGSMNQSVTEKQAKIDELQASIEKLRLDNTKLTNDYSLITSKLTKVDETLKSEQAANEKLQGDLQTAWSRLNNANEEKNNLAGLFKEAQKTIERLEKGIRVTQRNAENLKAQNEELVQKLDDIRRRDPQAVAAAEQEPVAPAGIAGTVSSVSGNLASANVGSAHGVKTGMKLIVYRGDQFVGNLKIEQVDVSECAGIVVDKKLDPMQGDRVMSPAGLEMN